MLKDSLLRNRISTKTQFKAGGDGVPIMTLASGQSTKGISTQGLAVGTTTLGPNRIAQAIDSDNIFYPPGDYDAKTPDVMFSNIGNRVYQPDPNLSLPPLLKKLGDQKFKAKANQKFEEYLKVGKLAKDLDTVSRNVGLEALGQSREILRTLVDTRRKITEQDYLRKMLDSGLSLDDAEKEIEGARKARALQEFRTLDDRPYQAKMLIHRLAMSRGAVSQVKAPLNSSGNIDSPQTSMLVAEQTGQTAFGHSPIDAARVFLTPDFYKRFARRSLQSQEGIDQQTAINSLISEGMPEDIVGGTNASIINAQGREANIQRQREGLASMLDNRKRFGGKIMLPLPPIMFAPAQLGHVYSEKNKTVGASAMFHYVNIADMSNFNKVVAINQVLALNPDSLFNLKTQLAGVPLLDRTGKRADPGLLPAITQILVNANGSDTFRIPFSNDNVAVTDTDIAKYLEEFRSESGNVLNQRKTTARTYKDKIEEADRELAAQYETAMSPQEQDANQKDYEQEQALRRARMSALGRPIENTRRGRAPSEDREPPTRRRAPSEDKEDAARPVEAAPRFTKGSRRFDGKPVSSLTKPQLKDALEQVGLPFDEATPNSVLRKRLGDFLMN